MSANNYILVDRKKFSVSLRDADTAKLVDKIGKGKALENAVDIAMKYQEAELVEYGIRFTKKSCN